MPEDSRKTESLVRLDEPCTGIAVVRFNDPDRRNAMTEAMGDALVAAVESLSSRSDLRVVVLTGEPPAFSAGGDLDMLEDLGHRTREESFDATATMRAFYDRFLSLQDLPVPVIAAVNGAAVGAGACVALACDLRLVAEDAKVGWNFARLGLHPGMGATWSLTRAAGTQRATELLMTGRIARGAELADSGLFLETLPSEQVLPRSLELATQIAASSPVVVRQLKRTLAGPPDLSARLDREAQAQAVNYGTEDLREGLAALRERRQPVFPGR